MPEPIDVVEAMLFASDAPLEADRIREVLDLASVGEARALVDELRQRCAEQGRALQVVEAGGGFRMVTRPEVAPWLVRLARSRTRSRLSRPAVETLAIIAYRQPVSRPEIDAIRGVSSEAVLDNLFERRMIRIGGRKEAPGRPFLYETTREFLVAFGLRDLDDLPQVDGELGSYLDDQVRAPGPVAAGSGGSSEEAVEARPDDLAMADTATVSTADEDATQQGPGADGADEPPRG
jgi:segregation and condensation protein B